MCVCCDKKESTGVWFVDVKKWLIFLNILVCTKNRESVSDDNNDDDDDDGWNDGWK